MDSNVQLDKEQIEMFAYNIFRDIDGYIRQNQCEFLFWIRDEIFDNSIDSIIWVLDKGIVKLNN